MEAVGDGRVVVDHWVNHLRKATKESRTSNGYSGGNRASRPSSSTTSLRPLSITPSLLSLDNGQLISPTTTAGTSGGGYPPRSPVQQRNSNNPPALPPKQHQYRSHNSIPPVSSHNHSSRHREQSDRVYSEGKYDAEFDRGTNPRAGPSNSNSSSQQQQHSQQQQSSSSTSNTTRGLFNPDGPLVSRSESETRRREDGTLRKPRSKRDPVEAADLGNRKGKESKESFDSEEAEGGRSSSRSSKDRHRRRRDGEGRRREDEGGVSTSTSQLIGPSASNGTSNASRQLFDPRRDDPVKFAQGGGTSSRKSKTASVMSDTRSFTGSIASLASVVSTSETLNVGGDAHSVNGGRSDDPNPLVSALRRAYRHITELETQLQDEHRAAATAAAREEESGQGVRIQGGAKKYDDDYWVKLATSHKKLAEAHTSFLEMALDPRVPASFHGLPQKYHTPSRLWQIGFHQLLERMRHAVTSTPSSSNAYESHTNVLEHLIEFIQYAYTHYSQLFEDPKVALFRSAWIEQLGDLARYRMAVAGMASRVSAASNGQSSRSRLEFEIPKENIPRPIEEASIGDAALGDWEIEEQDTWREMAKDWYGQGIAETPGAGRLQHHLALLSKGDELKGLYHYAKSLTATHPYISAKESILPLFEDDLQARRTQPDVTKSELFVHLHGMLFTKISLDNFDECMDRFLERLKEDAVLIDRSNGDWESLGSTSARPFNDSEWFMLAVVNISALLQFGADDGVLKKHSGKEPLPPTSRPSNSAAPKSKTPQAIMLNPSSLKRSDTIDATLFDELEPALSEKRASTHGEFVMQLAPSTEEDDPIVFRLAQRLTFGILEILLQHPFRIVSGTKVLNPYITLVLTFLSHISQQLPALRHLERAIPWRSLVSFFNSIPTSIEIKMDLHTRLPAGPLPEDWCFRGMDWTGRNLYGRGYWKSKSSSDSRRDDMPPIGPPSAGTVESEMESLKFNLEFIDEYSENMNDLPSSRLATARWKRVATTASWLARMVAGLDFDSNTTGRAPKFSIVGHLETKLKRWKIEERETAEAERLSRVRAWTQNDQSEIEESESESESDEEEEDLDDSEEMRDLKARRRQLKAVIRQARQATRAPRDTNRQVSVSKSSTRSKPSALKVFAGYTVLVFDTNVLLASMKLFKALIESGTWTIVVPLAVITELDGLKRNSGQLGAAAIEAITYLEFAIKAFARHLKVQTSRGNYLKDLTIRSETIDFASDAATTFSHDTARSMDDVILRAVGWQQDHFVSRLALVNPSVDRRSVPSDASTVVLVTSDRNLRLKARARGLEVSDEKGLKAMLQTKKNG